MQPRGKAYEECQRGVEFLRRHEGDAIRYGPSLFVKKRRATTSQDEPVADEPVAPTPIHVVTELAPTG